MSMQFDPKSKGIQVISRAADILRVLSTDTGGLSLGQIAHKVDLPRSTVQRIVSALSAEGFISTEQGHGGVRLGPEIQSLARATARDAKDQLRPFLQRIAEETGETVDLALLDGNKMLFIDQIVGRQRLRTVSSIGERFPLTTTANGKAALACLPETEAARLIISELEQGGPNRSLPDVLATIESIRNGALAADEGEHTEGISALGFAIEGDNGDIHAISIPVPSSRYDRLRQTLTEVLERYRRSLSPSAPLQKDQVRGTR